jgi:hypothetical protein
MKGKRQWLGRRVWVADADGTRRNGTLWFTNESNVLVREDGRVGLVTLPKEAEGSRWGFAEGDDKPY